MGYGISNVWPDWMNNLARWVHNKKSQRRFTIHDMQKVQEKVERGDYHRASHLGTCPICGWMYKDHVYAPILDSTGHPWLTLACNGDLLKL